jgi:signal transduction histidine kinase
MKWPGAARLPFAAALRVPFRLRVFFRSAFALLALATLGLALSVLQDEKERSHRVYADSLRQNQAQIAARLRHPTGQLMLLNPGLAERATTPVAPLVLPFAAIDFDDRSKAQQAVEMAGCALQYPDGATLCAAVGNNPFAGGFLYVVGSLASRPWVSHVSGELDLSLAHRASIEVSARGRTWRWTAPFEAAADNPLRGRLTGFDGDQPLTGRSRPQRDFRGWLWQEPRCLKDAKDVKAAEGAVAAAAASVSASAAPAGADGDDCPRQTFYSVRLPVELFQEVLGAKPVVWPPPDLHQMVVRVKLLPAAEGPALFDSDTPGAQRAFSVADLQSLLLPGEVLTVRREGSPQTLLRLTGAVASSDSPSPWIDALIRRLPVDGFDAPLQARETLTSSLGRYELELSGNLRPVNRQLAAVATRLSGFVGAMLAAVLLTWLSIEVILVRRMTLLTQRAAAVSTGMRSSGELPALDLADLRGSDELGVLAQGLHDLLLRVNDDVRREQIRAVQEKDQWHAVGHEIMSPLQSLMALHGRPGDPAERYITRMQQAVRVLYGQASPSEAFASTTLQLQPLDLNAFLGHVAGNAGYIGIEQVVFEDAGRPLMVRADEYSLEDVVTHLLRNADRHRAAGTPIRISAAAVGAQAQVRVHNQGSAVGEGQAERIFEYGVSEHADADGGSSHRGQGLFVVRTYMAKMSGTVQALNVADGVVFELTLPLNA